MEPSVLEIFLTRLALLLAGRAVYGAFADRLPLEGGERVLDFGCGMGTVARFAARRLPRGQLLCADVSRRWLAACRRTLRGAENVSFLLWEAESGPPAGEFHVIYCHFVLHHIPPGALEKTVSTLAALLKPGGALVFREPLSHAGHLIALRRLLVENALALRDSRVTDVPLMGNALESIYLKQNQGGTL